MKHFLIYIALLSSTFFYAQEEERSVNPQKFNIEKDFLLIPFDCKPDVDDIHTVVAFKMLLANDQFANLKYHPVAGAYGIQKSLYVPPNELFKLAFKKDWTDIHNKPKPNIKKVLKMAKKSLCKGGDVWIAEAGQSDFSAKIVKAINAKIPEVDTNKRVHIVQHSKWNEKVTSPEALKYVKENTDYYKIPDGNKIGNGTPGFKTADFTDWMTKIKDPKFIALWHLATKICEKNNGKEGRYFNKAIGAGGLDFSDLSEVLWILNIDNINTSKAFFSIYGK